MTSECHRADCSECELEDQQSDRVQSRMGYGVLVGLFLGCGAQYFDIPTSPIVAMLGFAVGYLVAWRSEKEVAE